MIPSSVEHAASGAEYSYQPRKETNDEKEEGRCREGREEAGSAEEEGGTDPRRVSHRDAVPDRPGCGQGARVLQEGVRREGDDAHGRPEAARSATPRSRSAIHASCSPTSIPEIGVRSPQTLGGSPVASILYVEDVDAVVDAGHRRRREADAAGQGPVLRRPLRARSRIRSATWHVATHKEDLSPDAARAARGAGGEAEAGLKNLQRRSRRRAPAIAPAAQMLISP